MKNTLIILSFLIHTFVWCQDEVLKFYPLAVVEMISDINEVKALVKADSLDKKDFFFTESYKGYKGLFFNKKQKDNWVVYDFGLGLNFGPNTFVKSIKEENNRFISVQLSRSPSGMCGSLYGKIILLDRTRNEHISFFNFNQWDCYDGNTKECKATFSIKGNLLEITSSKKPDDGLQCIKSGKYQYENGKFIRIE